MMVYLVEDPSKMRAAVRFANLVKRGAVFERAWDKAVAAGDEARMAEINQKADAYYASWAKYEGMGLRAQVVNGQYRITEVNP
jgi:hypothetical protein